MADYREQILKELTDSLRRVKEEEIGEMVEKILGARRVFCDGLGRSRLVMQGFAMRLVQLGLSGAMVGEVTAPALGKEDLLILCSASGASETLLYHAEKAKSYGGEILLITAKEQSALSEYARTKVLIEAPDKDAGKRGKEGNSASIQPMGSLFEQSAQLVCDAAVLVLMDRLGLTSEKMRAYHANIE